MKAFKDHEPKVSLDAHVAVAEFIRQQEELLSFIRVARNSDLNKIKIPLSILKWFKCRLGDVFQFLIAHIERHIQQAKRNLMSNEAKSVIAD